MFLDLSILINFQFLRLQNAMWIDLIRVYYYEFRCETISSHFLLTEDLPK
jgi:hypothetical protein